MDFPHIILIAAVFGGFLMAFSLGANDVANSMASAVGSKAISVKQAVVIACGLNFVGAVFLGAEVVSTISRGIISPDAVPDPNLFMLGMFAALLSSGLWVLVATFTALPVSSTHSIVGSLVGFGIVAGGPDVIHWGKLLGIVGSWLVSPFFGALLAFLVFSHIRKTILYSYNMLKAAKRWTPLWTALTVTMVVLSFCYKTPYGKSLNLSGWYGLAIALGATVLTMMVMRYHLPAILRQYAEDIDPGVQVDELFRRMQIGTACYVALSQGANDVANAIGPVVAIYFIATSGAISDAAPIPTWILIMGGVGIAIGILTMGYKVMDTVGERITKMNNTRGFSVAFSSATTVLMASNLGMPISTTHATVGSVVGVGLARGFHAVDFRVLAKILLFWVLTVPIAGFSCIVIFQVLRWTFL